MNYTYKILDTLCSPQYHGRGYVKNGDLKTANFIAKELKKWQVKSFNSSYFQEFKINVNTFGGKIKVEIDNKELIAGKDYLVLSKSKSVKGKFKLHWLTNDILVNNRKLKKFGGKNFSNSFIAIDTTGLVDKEAKKIADAILAINPFGAKGIVEITNRNLMYLPSSETKSPHIQIKKDKIKSNAKFIDLEIENELKINYTTRNLSGFIQGKSDSLIVFSAHYDHVGRMGKNAYFPGANDNGSGVSMLLNLAKYYSQNQPKYSIGFIFFSAEELGLLGSKFYSENSPFPLGKIKFLFNLDMIGNGDKGMTAVNGTEFKRAFNLLKTINKEEKLIKKINPRNPAANSDHYFFYKKGVPCFFIYTLGEYSEYHNIYDKADAVPLHAFENLFRLLTSFVERF